MMYSAVVRDKYDNNKVKFIKNQEYSRKKRLYSRPAQQWICSKPAKGQEIRSI